MAINLASTEVQLKLYVCFERKCKFIFDVERFNDCHTIFICESGRFKYEIDGGSSGIVSSGGAVFCPAGKTLRRHMIEPTKLHVLHIDFDEPIQPNQLPSGQIDLEDFARIKSNFKMIESNTELTNFDPCERHYLLDVWYTIARQLNLLGIVSKQNITDPVVLSALNYIKNHLREHITINSLASRYGLTSVAFIRRFSRELGETPMNYIINLRIRNAAKLLTETHCSIAEAAEACGYENEFYFSNSFKKLTGMSPSAYREAAKV
ncbi:MAG: helix-turn-helix transcriptional regulator [Clostridiales bacterium]|nr:helix-turn-helix transcriptional regulator [Clostridiales bacterium]